MDKKRCFALALIWSLILGACAPAEVPPSAPESSSPADAPSIAAPQPEEPAPAPAPESGSPADVPSTAAPQPEEPVPAPAPESGSPADAPPIAASQPEESAPETDDRAKLLVHIYQNPIVDPTPEEMEEAQAQEALWKLKKTLEETFAAALTKEDYGYLLAEEKDGGFLLRMSAATDRARETAQAAKDRGLVKELQVEAARCSRAGLERFVARAQELPLEEGETLILSAKEDRELLRIAVSRTGEERLRGEVLRLLEEEGIPQELAEIQVLSEAVNPDT